MQRSAFLREFEKIINATEGSLSNGANLRDLEGWNSLAMVEFVAFVDSDFNITLDSDQLAKCESVEDLLAMLPGQISD